jgi:hypothetical protein
MSNSVLKCSDRCTSSSSTIKLTVDFDEIRARHLGFIARRTVPIAANTHSRTKGIFSGVGKEVINS